MSIPESQLETWSHQGSITQSSTTYGTVRRSLEAADSGYADQLIDIFLQGSYCNSTNIYAESDVDVVIRRDSTFNYDLTALTPVEAATFHSVYSESASYAYAIFKSDVIAALRKSFGYDDVTSGTKAIKIRASGSRRSADVVVANAFRRFSSFPNILGEQSVDGMSFFTSTGERIVNYPKQHSENCTIKHQNTSRLFKPMVRIVKNMRSKLVADGVIEDGLAPSYFIEGLLYNVPNGEFGTNYTTTFLGALVWLLEADVSTLRCANEQGPLVRDSSAVCWPAANCKQFLSAITSLWQNWR
jgi:hypothetical protein